LHQYLDTIACKPVEDHAEESAPDPVSAGAMLRLLLSRNGGVQGKGGSRGLFWGLNRNCSSAAPMAQRRVSPAQLKLDLATRTSVPR
jgi:hypothetical protein